MYNVSMWEIGLIKHICYAFEIYKEQNEKHNRRYVDAVAGKSEASIFQFNNNKREDDCK